MSKELEFDRYAESYDAALAQGLSVTGEDKTYFAHGRIAWLSRCLTKLRVKPETAMDFGCGTGSAARYLFDLLAVESLIGLDVSRKSLELAKQMLDCERSRFLLASEYKPNEDIDLIFCNGVLHHIPVDERADAIRFVYKSLKPGGLFALWENNPWNPGTRYIMGRCSFDRDAIALTPPEARGLLRAAGFEVLSTDFLFIFPRALGWLRWIEPIVSKLPLGGQYQVLCRRS